MRDTLSPRAAAEAVLALVNATPYTPHVDVIADIISRVGPARVAPADELIGDYVHRVNAFVDFCKTEPPLGTGARAQWEDEQERLSDLVLQAEGKLEARGGLLDLAYVVAHNSENDRLSPLPFPDATDNEGRLAYAVITGCVDAPALPADWLTRATAWRELHARYREASRIEGEIPTTEKPEEARRAREVSGALFEQLDVLSLEVWKNPIAHPAHLVLLAQIAEENENGILDTLKEDDTVYHDERAFAELMVSTLRWATEAGLAGL